MIRVLELRSVRGTGGGPEKTILFGATRHDPTRFAVTVCYIRDERDDVFTVDRRAANLDLNYVEILERHSFDRAIWPTLVDLVRSRRIDIVHGHEYKTDLLAWLLARRMGITAVATAHGWTGDSWRERWVYYPIDRWVLARLPRVVAVSSEVADVLSRAGADRSRIDVLLNGIDPSVFRRDEEAGERIRDEQRLGADAVVIGAVGRLERQKRFDLLLDAFARLKRDRPSLTLVIVGDGSLRMSLQEQARRYDLRESCCFLGHRHDIAALHSAFDFFVQSSEYEGTPNAVLEAMAMETPIVATDVGGTRELVRHGVDGLIVPPHDVPALVAAMASLLDDRDGAARRARSARARVEHELSFAERTRRLEAIYEELAGARTSRHAAAATRSHAGAGRA